ncbi:MAG: HIRAN domain-containing protein [gamma proteobacterium endosymbiont of Lamellibrachia anaximandri]|nr:HIRAN domain-containing protein [gamma proteobacterium endosymbiont of Lamellibrachia anaximandri]
MQRRTFLHTLFGSLGIGLSGRINANTQLLEPKRRVLLQESPLAGYQYHRASGIWQFLQIGETLKLRREPANRYDRNAIAVWFKNEHLGYVPRSENRTLAQMMDRGEQLEGRIVRLLEDDNPWRRVRFSVFLSV